MRAFIPEPRRIVAKVEQLMAWVDALETQLVGIDHAFSLLLRYFEVYRIPPEWPQFLDGFQHHWPTDDDHMCVEVVQAGIRS